jgi:hypothetical protein
MENKITFFRRLKIWWDFEGRYLPIDFLRGIKNIIYWLPIIWKDRDYDDHYIWEVLKHKLKKQSAYLKVKGIHLSHSRDVQIIDLCVKLIDKIQYEYYINEFLDYYEAELDFVETGDNDLFEMKSREIWQNFDAYFAKYPSSYRKVNRGQSKYKTASRLAGHNHDKARRILFTLLERNTEKWWN